MNKNIWIYDLHYFSDNTQCHVIIMYNIVKLTCNHELSSKPPPLICIPVITVHDSDPLRSCQTFRPTYDKRKSLTQNCKHSKSWTVISDALHSTHGSSGCVESHVTAECCIALLVLLFFSALPWIVFYISVCGILITALRSVRFVHSFSFIRIVLFWFKISILNFLTKCIQIYS